MEKKLLVLAMFMTISFIACNQTNKVEHEHTNHLIKESSPYLLQHAHNPVDWYPWGEEALAKAKEENKMLLISVGYSACHWCHVMEHESFEDTTVSRIMNANFINIKVDREERPDVDDVYMSACLLAGGGSCGWPLNSFALPDGRPVWAGTYFPKKNWIEILEYFTKIRKEEPEKLEEFAAQLTQGIQINDQVSKAIDPSPFENTALADMVTQFLEGIDFKRGGKEGAPKFPMPNNYDFLLRYGYLFQHEKALEAVYTTLDQMAMGGIYDQLGGGFARYSTDSRWLVPHFEKMLYDNGQLVSLYANAYKATQNPLYEKVVEETLQFVERELTDESGGFYSSLDADSEGEEGKFYVWTQAEIDTLLEDETLGAIYAAYYGIREKGNWEAVNILHRTKTDEAIAAQFELSESELQEKITSANQILFTARSKRVRPGLDDKVLTSWNALMLQGYIDAYQAFGQEAYLQTAIKNAEFIEQQMMQEDGRLNRNYKDGKSVINAFLDDYGLTSQAYIKLYEVTFDEKWLYLAKKLTDYAITHFKDDDTGMFYYTSDIDPPLVTRKMVTSDNVIPASNSIMARVLHLMGTYLYNEEYLAQSKQMLQNILPSIGEVGQPSFYSNWLNLYLDQVRPPYEVAILGQEAQAKRMAMQQQYLPHALFLGGNDEGTLELLKNKLQEDITMIYVCQNKSCKLPVEEVEKALGLIE